MNPQTTLPLPRGKRIAPAEPLIDIAAKIALADDLAYETHLLLLNAMIMAAQLAPMREAIAFSRVEES